MIYSMIQAIRHTAFQLLSIFVWALWALPLAAQTETSVKSSENSASPHASDSLRTVASTPMSDAPLQPEMTLYVPTFQPTAYGLYGYGPYHDGSLATNWQLHQGFNVQFSMNMTCGFGKNRIKGVGFGQTAAFAYVQPITSKFSIATGLYASNFDWGPWHTTDVGISGILAYQVTDRLSVYAFGSKSFIPRQNNFNGNGLAMPAYWMRPDNRFGAAAEFKFSEHFKMGVSVERVGY